MTILMLAIVAVPYLVGCFTIGQGVAWLGVWVVKQIATVDTDSSYVD